MTLWTVAHQAPLSLGFSRQEYWSGLPFPSPVQACMLSRFSRVRLCATLWTAAHQAPLSTGFSRQEYWSGLPFPSPLPMARNALSVALVSSATAQTPERTPGCREEHVPERPQTGWLPSGEGPGHGAGHTAGFGSAGWPPGAEPRRNEPGMKPPSISVSKSLLSFWFGFVLFKCCLNISGSGRDAS